MSASAASSRAPVSALAIVFALSQGLRVEELLRLPIRVHLKETLGLSPSAMAGFFFAVGLTWYVKPLIGLWIDAASARANQRQCIIFGALSVLTWGVLPASASDESFLLLVLIVLNLYAVYASTAGGGYLVAWGKECASLDRLSAARVQATSAASIFTGLISGALATVWLGWVCVIGGALSVVMFGRLARITDLMPWCRRDAAVGEGRLLSRRVLGVAILMFAFHAAPGYETLLFFRQTDQLGFSELAIGLLFSVRCVGAVIGAWGFTRIRSHGWTLGLVPFGIVINGASALLYLGYGSMSAAIAIELIASALSALTLLPLYELAARVCPSASAAFGFGIMLSVGNFALAVSDVLGSTIAEQFSLSFGQLVVVYAAATAASALLYVCVPAESARSDTSIDAE